MKIIFVIVQLTWGIFQTLLGLILFLANINKPHFWYNGAIVTDWEKPGGISLGLFAFAGLNPDKMRMKRKPRIELTPELCRKILVHEYGHCVQSLVLGPLYLPIVGILSLAWAGLPPLRKWRKKNKISYAWFFIERWANVWGEKFTGEESIRDLI